ncbi:MAG: hydroxyisourate hydrolase [Pseudomonadota bacterium]
MGKLTTHVLNTARGIPAADVAIRLFSTDQPRTQIATTRTNADGRAPAPLLDERSFAKGTYELEFAVADYFKEQNSETGSPPFLDTVTLRFTISDDSHYHIPLLVSPWSYSTYRGS